MKRLFLILLIALSISSCSVVSRGKSGCGNYRDVMRHDSKPFRAFIQKPGTISENTKQVCARLIEVKRTMRGFKHTFVSGDDTAIMYQSRPMKLDTYLIRMI